MSTISSFKDIENNHDVYKGQYYIKKFCEFLRKNTIKILSFKKTKNEVSKKGTIGVI